MRYSPRIEFVRSLVSSTSTKKEIRKRQSQLFDDEKKRERASIGRIEKIEVKHCTWEEDITLSMNKYLSTPYDCARHISEGMAKMSALAVVNGTPWDMHRPLTEDCELKLSTMRTPHDKSVNSAFWRTCSLMLGAVVDSAFKDDIAVRLHSFTGPNIRSGSFIYDVELGLENWECTASELRSISALFAKLVHQSLPVERLETSPGVALNIFEDNPHKSKQIPDIASANNNKIVLYRIGEHVDISKGPVIGNTGLVGRCTIAAIHKIQTDDGLPLYRFQGVAIPNGILLNHFAYGILENRAKNLNQTTWMPHRLNDENEDKVLVAANN